MMTLQICAIMLQWQVAWMMDESFFMARWILAWSEMAWVQLRANLQSTAMPPRLSDLDKKIPALPLIVPFKVPLILRNAAARLWANIC